MANSRCTVPFYPDPGQSNDPKTFKKVYLVTGRLVKTPGAYSSWPSASAQYSGVSKATMKSYKDWDSLQAAWFAGCDRGEHDHESPPAQQPVRSSPMKFGAAQFALHTPACEPSPRRIASPSQIGLSPTLAPTASLASREPRSELLRVPSRIRTVAPAAPTTPSSTREPRSEPLRVPSRARMVALAVPTISLSSREPRSEPLRVPSRAHTVAPSILGLMAYSVRSNDGQGVVFDDFEAARSLYHHLQLQGHSVTLASSPSLTDSVSWVEEFFFDSASRESARRRAWIQEEYAARECRMRGFSEHLESVDLSSESSVEEESSY
ncbi:hypothetical protein B0H19DRAFT_1379166 [Mycena capillaripes]|nr:hypothetical protein B0H19DRAFT_1379166 [Mycena capillaripes]